MNFFEHQDRANRNTRWLVVFFILAVISIIVLTDLLVIYSYFIFTEDNDMSIEDISVNVHITIALVISLIVFLASVLRMFDMRAGGQAVAEALGGRLIPSSTDNLNERRLLNVVEEMSIASGIPVPQVYLLDEGAINAFAAGYSHHDAVIGVTRGTIELLNRDELQGVIAHEFSHIFNGDMRLNLHLTGVLFGILFIGLVGENLLNATSRSRSRYYSSRRSDDTAQLALFGVGLMIIGYTGVFFGNLIKATVSRQREFLADASAVQFTRNADGIGGALKKIGGWSSGSRLYATNASEYSHFYIAKGVPSSLFGFFSTHPPLPDRILRVEPGWDGNYPKVKKVYESVENPASEKRSKPFSAESFKDPGSMITTAMIFAAISKTGLPTSDHVRYANKLISNIPEPLLLASKEPLTAYALVLGLIMDKQLLKNMSQMDLLLQGIDTEICKTLRNLLPTLISLDIKYRLPLLELAIPSLKSLSESQTEKFNEHMLRIIKHDNRVEFWEWALHRIITLSLGKPILAKPRYDNFSKLEHECCVLLSAVIYSSNVDKVKGVQAYKEAANELGVSMEIMQRDQIINKELINAISKINQLKPLVKPRFLKALSLAAEHDGVIEPEEIEFIRAIAEGIDCPMPPLLDSADKLEKS